MWYIDLPISFWKRIIICLLPLTGLIIENFSFQCIWRSITTSDKRRLAIRTQWFNRKMREYWWWFILKAIEWFAIESRWTISIFDISFLWIRTSNLRVPCIMPNPRIKPKHNSEWKSVTPSKIKFKRHFANTCQSAVLNFTHLNHVLYQIIYITDV